MNILEAVKTSWGWVGIDPVELITENKFGNLILKDADDKFWRLCPEEVYCNVIAESIDDYNVKIEDDEFNKDWFMESMVEDAEKNLGALAEGHRFHLQVPGVLGGDYEGSNIKSSPLLDIIKLSGDLGKRIQDLPEGAEIDLSDEV